MLKTVGFPSTRTGDQTIVSGNLVIGTAGKGIDFSAASHAAGMTSELLNDYEEGTFTGTLTSATPPTTPITATGYYTKVGRLVTASVAFRNVNNTGASGQILVSGLPFASNASMFFLGQANFNRATASPMLASLDPSGTQISIVDTTTNAVSWASAGPFVYGTVQITYMV